MKGTECSHKVQVAFRVASSTFSHDEVLLRLGAFVTLQALEGYKESLSEDEEAHGGRVERGPTYVEEQQQLRQAFLQVPASPLRLLTDLVCHAPYKAQLPLVMAGRMHIGTHMGCTLWYCRRHKRCSNGIDITV